jgi:Protein of unknown function (DUF3726)
MEVSLNELETLAQKAVRGAGYAWGLADDAGRSARWLAMRGGDWATGLLALLDRPPPTESCPLRLGCFLADSAAASGKFAFASVLWPAWMLPPLFAAATLRGVSVLLRFDDMDIASGGTVATASEQWPRILAMPKAAVQVSFGDGKSTLPHAQQSRHGRPRLLPSLAARLEAYAARTYVAATHASRTRGAGSLTRDDD